ncbi:MAG: hypothetical protein Q9221_006943 [Calogaya cf. arnoldii]
MATDVRNTFSGRLSLVGPQLQTLWQETLTTGYILKQAFSAAPTSPSSDSSINTSDDEPSQHDLPLNPQEPIVTHATARREPVTQADKATQIVCDTTAPVRTSADYTSEFRGSPWELGHGMETVDDNLPLFDHCEDNGPSAPPHSLTSSERLNDNGAPEIHDGPSEVIVASHNNQHCLAVLVTKEMIEYMNDITEDTKALHRLQDKTADVDQRVNFTRINVEYCEKLLEKAESQEEITELREDIERRRSTLPEDEKYLGAMQRKIGFAKSRLTYSNDQSRSLLRKALNDAGLLQLPNEHKEEDEDDNVSQASESEAGYEAETICSDVSDISIEELAKRATREEVQAKYEEYLQAERNFDSRGEEYTHQKHLLEESILVNPDHPLTHTILDLCFIEQEQELTRDLVAAEEAYEEARARARFFGPNEWDQESCFVTDEYDGYPLSWENDRIASTPSEFIYGWLEDIPDVEDPLSIAELDVGAGQEFGQVNQEDLEVCDIRSVQLSDAWSSHDCSRNRKRVDRWRAMNGRDR